MGVIDKTQDRAAPGNVREQAQRGHEYQEPPATDVLRLPERGPQGVCLRVGQVGQPSITGERNRWKSRERQRRLRLHPLGPQYPDAPSVVSEVGEKGGLPHPGLAADDQGTTMRGSCFGHQFRQHGLSAVRPYSTSAC